MLHRFEAEWDLPNEILQEPEIEEDELDSEIDEEDEQEPKIDEKDPGPFYLDVYNSCTGEYETVEVNREVYLYMRRSAWREAKRTRTFFKKQIQFTSMSKGESSQIENYHEFASSDPTPEEALIQKKRKQLAVSALDALTPTMRKYYLMHHYDGLSLRKIAKIEGKDKKTIAESIKSAQKIVEKFLRNFEK